LDITGKKLEKIPENIFMLKNLEELNVSNNELRNITPFVKKLNKLKKLNFTKNLLTKLPDVLWTMPSLEEIWVDEKVKVKNRENRVIIPLVNTWKNHEKWNSKQLRDAIGICVIYNKK